ncbi:hypothetical protein CRG98_023075 [Punica granatum]|uniref:Uncharacterized protein n=1 Tax=Punica granatum TaxID=22663 RepID=A0A2I0JJW0_PUNGR|nr:hypothetical protein CRG98_023075 [Punica granatum]
MNCNAKIVNRFLDAQAYSSFGLLAQLDQFIDFTVSKWIWTVDSMSGKEGAGSDVAASSAGARGGGGAGCTSGPCLDMWWLT